MIGQNPFTEEGRTRWKNFERRLAGYLVIAFVLGLLAGFGFFRLWTRANMAPLQKLYLMQYALGSIKAAVSEKTSSRYKLLTYQVADASGKTATGGVTDAQVHAVRDREGRPIRNEAGFVFAWNGRSGGELSWRRIKVNDRQMTTLLCEHNYEDESFFELLIPSGLAGLIGFLTGLTGLIIVDQKLNRKYEEGVFLRGTRLVEPEKFKLEGKTPGLGVPSLSLKKNGWFGRWRRNERIYWLHVPREEEAAHATILGDTGTGKSQLIHLFLWQIAARNPQESVIIYDPAGEFLASHFVAERGDIVLNPLDERFPFWNPAAEVRLKTDREMIAESFFPGNDQHVGAFFTKATRSIFARLLEFMPSPEDLVQWLINEEAIDKRVQGTELAHLINDKAPQQRGGVLGTLSEAGSRLKMLPARGECAQEILLTDWARERRGWIFVTSTQDTRAQLKPLQAIFLDLLMKRLMACDPAWGREHPCWMIVDEAHALGKMPALYMALTEGRKFGLKLILGTQNKNQFQEHYGESSATMLSASVLKIIFRCNEPDSARWVSELIGESEWEKPKIGTTAAVADQGKDSLHYSNNNERKPVVSREEIMALDKLHGYWKYQNIVAPFRFEARNWPARTERFLARKAMLAEAEPEEIVQTREPQPSEEPSARQPTYRFHRKVVKAPKTNKKNSELPMLPETKAAEPAPEKKMEEPDMEV